MSVIARVAARAGADQRAERAARDEALALALRQAGTQVFLKDWYQQPLWGLLRRSPRCAGGGTGANKNSTRHGNCSKKGCKGRGTEAVAVPGGWQAVPPSLNQLHRPATAATAAHRFRHMLGQRQAGDAQELSTALASMSPGRAPSLWAELRGQQLHGAGTADSGQGLPQLLLVVGEEDAKFVELGRKLCEAINGAAAAGESEAAGSGGGGASRAELQVVPGCGHAVHVERPLELLSILDAFLSKDG